MSKKDEFLASFGHEGHINDILDGHDHNLRRYAMRNITASSENIDKGLSDDDNAVRYIAAKHPNANKAHIDRALLDESPDVRRGAISNPEATEEHAKLMQHDTDSWVRETANRRLARTR